MKPSRSDLTFLGQQLCGELLFDPESVSRYQHDASPCESRPVAVVCPQDKGDCLTLLEFAVQHELPVTPRGAGTSLAGQGIGEGLVVDFSSGMNRILEIDVEHRTARVQPGVVLADLNQALQAEGLFFPPDPSTQDRCNIGGMVGNNSWGIHAIAYGTTRDHVLTAEVLLADCTDLLCEPLNQQQWQEKCRLHNREGEIYRGLKVLIDAHLDPIRQAYPSYRGIPNNAGYALDVLANMQPWQSDGAAFNLAPLICGSEGGLGMATEFTLRLIERPAHRCMTAISYRDLYVALEQVEELLAFPVSAVELLDENVLALAAEQFEATESFIWLSDLGPAVLLIEMVGNESDVLADAMNELLQGVGNCSSISSITHIEENQIDRVWEIRRAGLHMLMEQPFEQRAVTGIEDTAVAVPDLPNYVREVHELLAGYSLNSVNYGPVSMGGLHIRPRLNRPDSNGSPDVDSLLDEVASIVASYGGSLSAKHGDGRLRGRLVGQTLGLPVVELLKRVRHLFDPQGIMNPLPLD